MTDQRQPKFAVGDLVRHRASGERGVVTSQITRCVNPEHSGYPGIAGSGARCTHGRHLPDCTLEFIGGYSLSLSAERSATLNEILLERVDDEHEEKTP